MNKPTLTALKQSIAHWKRLAIFVSNCGYAGPVIQDYQPFDDELKAISEAKVKIKATGLPLDLNISRPRITSIRASFYCAKISR